MSTQQDALRQAAQKLIELRHSEATRDHELITGIDALEAALASQPAEAPAVPEQKGES